MKRHRLGPAHGMPLECLSMTRILELPVMEGELHIKVTVSPRVVADELLLQIKFSYRMPYYEAVERSSKKFSPYLMALGYRRPDICPHLRASQPAGVLYQDINHRLRDPMCGVLGQYGEVVRCRDCNTEYQIVMQRLGYESTLATHINVWKNLGQCKTPTDEC